ncbi:MULTISPECIES: hypothetical protein [unclassified Streptomyces]|uniref:hypothetical protein n=1 Tax=unclassified Streptomyces TaxID=2593676 RepID=UPI00365FA3A5
MSEEQQRPDLTEWAKSLDARRAELRGEEAEFDQAVRLRDRLKEDAYRRAHPELNPAIEADQRAAAKGTAAAQGWTGPGLAEAVRNHNGRMLARAGVEIDPPRADVLRGKMLALLAEYEEATEVSRAGREAAHGLREVADRYERAQTFEECDDITEQAGASLSLPEAGLIRRLSKALEGSLPGLIVDAHVDGMNAPSIARQVGCSDRHAYKVIKDYPWEALWTLYRATGDDEWEEVAAELIETTDTADDLANRIIGQRLTDDLARTGARVLVWRAGDGNDPDDARGECVIEASAQNDH